MDSILTSVKKMLGIDEAYTHFDTDIIMHINSIFNVLTQIGVGPEDGYQIQNADDLWSDFLGDTKLLNTVKSYMYLRVKLLFDPPATSSAGESLRKIADEFEWRISVTVDPKREVIQNG